MTKSKTLPAAIEVGPPPYISYRTFSGFIERLHKRVPNRVDRSVMSFLSGSNQSQLMAALRYLELISEKGLPSERLTRLLNSDTAGVNRYWREVVLTAYPFLFKNFDLQKATYDELRERFIGAGASGDTVRKCVAFFLGAARQAGLQISPFVTSRSRLRVRTTQRGSPREEKLEAGNLRAYEQGEVATWREMMISKLPEFDTGWPSELKAKWFEAFNKLIDSVGAAEPDA